MNLACRIPCPSSRERRVFLRAAFALFLCMGCAISAGPAQAQQAPRKDPFAALFGGSPRTKVPPAAGFVRNSRPGREELRRQRALGRQEPERPPMTPEQVRETERQLDAIRQRHGRISGGRVQPPPARSVADGPRGRTKKQPRPCVLTCQTGIGTFQRR